MREIRQSGWREERPNPMAVPTPNLELGLNRSSIKV